jgi:hypothetical protein
MLKNKKEDNDFMWAFLVVHWWLPLVISLIIGAFISVIDDQPHLALPLVSIIFTIGLALSGVFYGQRWDFVLSLRV